jgi:hypothetical protein
MKRSDAMHGLTRREVLRAGAGVMAAPLVLRAAPVAAQQGYAVADALECIHRRVFSSNPL